MMQVLSGSRLMEEEKSRTAKLIRCLEHGGERLNDEETGLSKASNRGN